MMIAASESAPFDHSRLPPQYQVTCHSSKNNLQQRIAASSRSGRSHVDVQDGIGLRIRNRAYDAARIGAAAAENRICFHLQQPQDSSVLRFRGRRGFPQAFTE
jgi:hypothetical protein